MIVEFLFEGIGVDTFFSYDAGEERSYRNVKKYIGM